MDGGVDGDYSAHLFLLRNRSRTHVSQPSTSTLAHWFWSSGYSLLVQSSNAQFEPQLDLLAKLFCWIEAFINRLAMAGGRRRHSDKVTSSGGNSKTNNRRRRSDPPSSVGGALFVEGGFLADWKSKSSPLPSRRGGKPNLKSESYSSKLDLKASSSKYESGKSNGNAIRYKYPPVNYQEVLQFEKSLEYINGDNEDEPQSFVLVDSDKAQIVCYVDKSPSSSTQYPEFTYDYITSSVLGDNSHRGLGFCDEVDETPNNLEIVLEQMKEQEGLYFESPSSEKEMDTDNKNNCDEGDEIIEETLVDTLSARDKSRVAVSSLKKNSGFLSIGGMKLYTEDLTDRESDENDSAEMLEEGSSDSSEQGELSVSSDGDSSDIMSDGDSDVDDEVAKDYLEGIGGSETILNAKWLMKQKLEEFDDDSSSSSSFDETIDKLGGISLQEASREYGRKKAQSRKKNPSFRDDLSLALDDVMLVKDPRSFYAEKKHVRSFPQSWPLGAQMGKTSRKYHGEKKKHHKEHIAVKRRERMLNRGVDLEQINTKLEQIVLNGVDIFSFQPMHSRDCSQVQRLAAIYRLQSGRQGSGKKRFVTVTRTQHTNMPSKNDKFRLEQLLGVGKEEANFTVEGLNMKSMNGNRGRERKTAKGFVSKTLGGDHSTSNRASKISASKGTSEKKSSDKKGSYAKLPVSFVSNGILLSDKLEYSTIHPKNIDKGEEVGGSTNIGSFEVHTKGFGSKMMAKMGFIEGGGLGRDGKGISSPIEVIKRPKSLGLGVEFSDSPDLGGDTGANRASQRGVPLSNSSKNRSPGIGAFEKHQRVWIKNDGKDGFC